MSGEDKDTKTPEVETDGAVTEEDLLKSLSDLEGKKPEEKEPEAQAPVETASLEKSAADKVKEEGSDELKKALDVSSALSEITSLLGAHMDDGLESLQKSVAAGAERDVKIIAVLEKFQKSIDELSEKIAEFGGQPAKKPESKTETTPKTEILEKSTETGDAGEVPSFNRKAVLGTMERLAKSTENQDDRQRWVNAAVMFESTGQISNQDLLEVKGELAKAA